MNPTLKTYIVCFLLTLVSSSGFAQSPPVPTRAMVPPPPGLVVPIDDNIMLLLVAGLVFGLYIAIKARKKLT